jgi:Ca2+-binding RTX toxin-like protein
VIWLSDIVENITLVGSLNLDARMNGAVNIIIGNDGNNELWGEGNNDTIAGGLGDDRIDGGSGDDDLDGGDGIDTAVFAGNLAGYKISLVSPGEIRVGRPDDVDTITGVEFLQFADATINTAQFLGFAVGPGGVYASINDPVNPPRAMDDVVPGDKVFLIGGYSNETAVVSVDNLTFDAGSGSLEIVLQLGAGISSVSLAGFGPIDVIGNALGNTITGNNGNNLIDGGAGADVMAAGLGDDTYVVDDVGDSISDAGGIDTVRAAMDYALGTGFDNLVLTGGDDLVGNGNSAVNAITGNGGANILHGLAGNDSMAGGGGNDLLNGGVGADAMSGGEGDDIYYVDSASDSVTELAGQGYDTVRSSVTFSLAPEIERLVLRGTADLNGKGNDLANDVWGNAGANRLDGGAGDDRLNGGGGIDRLIGGLGDDVFVIDTAKDVVTEYAGQGTDRIESLVSKALVINVENLALRGTARINGLGNELANAITGNAGINLLDGKTGLDTLTGGQGRDSFAFSTALGAGNVDTITDFAVADDTIRLDDAIFANLGGLRWLAASAFFAGTAAHDADDRIIYDSATGALFYDADGAGGVAQARFATLGAGLAVTNFDFYVF